MGMSALLSSSKEEKQILIHVPGFCIILFPLVLPGTRQHWYFNIFELSLWNYSKPVSFTCLKKNWLKHFLFLALVQHHSVPVAASMQFWGAPVHTSGVIQHLPLPQTKQVILQRKKDPCNTGNGFNLFLFNDLLQKATTQMSSEAANDLCFLTPIQTSLAALPASFIHSSAFTLPFFWLARAVRQYAMCCPGGKRGRRSRGKWPTRRYESSGRASMWQNSLLGQPAVRRHK